MSSNSANNDIRLKLWHMANIIRYDNLNNILI